MAKVGEGFRERTWLMEECKSKNLPVRVARALVNPVTTTVPVRLLNLSSDTSIMFKGTKLATVEECNMTPIIRAMSINATTEKVPRISESKRQVLEEMVNWCAVDLERDHKEQFTQLVFEFADIFAEDGELGQTSKIKHSIHTRDAQPIRQPVQRVPLCQTEMLNLLTEMQDKDVIQPSQSPWASPVVLVQKTEEHALLHRLPQAERSDQEGCVPHPQD